MPAPEASFPLTVVTAADARYGRCVWQFLRSAERRRLPATNRFVVFDLGLASAQRAQLERDFPWCAWRRIGLPPHANPAALTYAWKPLVVAAAAAEFGGLVLWLDSATLFHGSLEEVAGEMRRHGVYTLAGQAALFERCDPEIAQFVGAAPEIMDRPERVAGVIGFDLANAEAAALLARWAEWARDARCWRAVRPNHKPDQALLSILLFMAERAGRLTLNGGEIDISSPNPVRWMSSRNKVAPGLPRWLDGVVRLQYFTVKAADQAIHRLRRFWRTRVSGWHRRTKEHFAVYVARDDGTAPTVLKAPPVSYYADPFLWRRDGRDWVFVEEFLYPENAARLVALPLAEGGVAGPAQPLALPDGHLSFPYLFEHDGELYLVPESSQRGVVDLYRCVDFPARWVLERRLLTHVNAADSVLFAQAGRWWLFTALREPGGTRRHLAIFHTDDFRRGEWQAHPVNAERRVADGRDDRGRCAGGMGRTPAGELLRPVHASPDYYGQGMAWRRIERLTPEEFVETEWQGPAPARAWLGKYSPHHVSWNDGWVAFDVRDHVGLLRRPRPRLSDPSGR